MKAVLAAALLAFGAFAALPSVSAADPSSQVPPPCGAADSWACPTPACRQTQVDQDTVLQVIGALGPWGMVYTGPLFGVRLNSDCTVDAWETRLDCWSTLLPLAYNEQNVSVGRADATVGTCGVGFVCACMPADVSSAPSVWLCPPVDRWDGIVHTTVSASCAVQVDIKAYDCVWNCDWHTYVQGPPATVRVYEQEQPEQSSAALPPIFPPCPSFGGCCGIEPPEGGCCGTACPPTVPHCPEEAVSTTQLFGFLGPSAAVATHYDCTADVGESGLPCPSLAPNRGSVDESVGPVDAHADTCVPELDCTCDPILAPASASIQPPVWVSFPVCVDGPCPPEVTCHVASGHVPEVSYSVSTSCHVTLTQDPLACEGMRYESTTVGPVTVNRASCGPGIDP